MTRVPKTYVKTISLLLTGAMVMVGVLQGKDSPALENRYARHFTITPIEGGHHLQVNQSIQGEGLKVFEYLLVGKEAKVAPKPGQWVIRVPVKRAVAISTTMIAAFEALDGLDALVGIGSFKYPCSEAVRDMIARKRLQEVGSEATRNLERMVALAPDVVLTHAIGNPDHDVHAQLAGLEINTCLTAYYLEPNLLARAEWLKVVGLLLGKLERSQEIFDALVDRYETLRRKVEVSVKERPSVLANVPWGNVWYVPSANSYVASMIADAGGDYLWKDSPSMASIPMSFEAVYERGLEADVWINAGYLDTQAALLAQDRRYLDFKAVREGRVYSESRRVNEHGGNDLWERGFVHPDEILADVITLLHPGLLPDHALIYYRKVE
jgi:iron complex transport system substrate-binding protein